MLQNQYYNKEAGLNYEIVLLVTDFIFQLQTVNHNVVHHRVVCCFTTFLLFASIFHVFQNQAIT